MQDNNFSYQDSVAEYIHKHIPLSKTKINILFLVDQKVVVGRQIATKLDLKVNYKTVWGHLQSLKRAGFILIKKEISKQGQPLDITLTELGKSYLRLFRRENEK